MIVAEYNGVRRKRNRERVKFIARTLLLLIIILILGTLLGIGIAYLTGVPLP